MCIVGAIIGAAAIGAAGSLSAAGTQADAQKQAAATQAGMFNTLVGQEQPFLQGGYGAESALNYLMGTGTPAPANNTAGPPGIDPSSGFQIGAGGSINQMLPGGSGVPLNALMGGRATWQQGMPGTGTAPQPGANFAATSGLPAGYLTETFNPTQAQLEAYPGYQFQLQQGDLALQSANSANGSALSGPALKSLMSFNQGLAASNYGNYFNQFQTQQTNIFNRLSAIAGMGQNAAGNLGNTGAQLGTGIAGAQAAAGGSLAGGIVGATNSIGNGVMLSSLFNQNSFANNPANQNPGNWDTSGPGNFTDFQSGGGS